MGKTQQHPTTEGRQRTMRWFRPTAALLGLSPAWKRRLSTISLLVGICCFVLFSINGIQPAWKNSSHQNLLSSTGVHSSWARPNHSASCQVHTLLKNLHQYEDLEAFYSCQKVYYNRVPKCASRTILSTVKNLSISKFFNFVSERRNNTSNYEVNDEHFLQYFNSKPEPLFYTQHAVYVNFTKYNMTPPVYINVVRDPLERVVSHFYFNKFGDETNVHLANSSVVNVTLDECVRDTTVCRFKFTRMLQFFCGNTIPCRQNNDNLLAIAKKTVKQEFLVVGIMEDLGSFMEVLETLMPHFFDNATNIYFSQVSRKSQKYKTRQKHPLHPETEEILRNILSKEFEFYRFVKQRFYNLLERVRSVKRKLYRIKPLFSRLSDSS